MGNSPPAPAGPKPQPQSPQSVELTLEQARLRSEAKRLQKFIKEIAPDGSISVTDFDQKLEHPGWPGLAAKWRKMDPIIRDNPTLSAQDIEKLMAQVLCHSKYHQSKLLTDFINIFYGPDQDAADVEALVTIVQTFLNWILMVGGWPVLPIADGPATITASLCAGLLERKKGVKDLVSRAELTEWIEGYFPKLSSIASVVLETQILKLTVLDPAKPIVHLPLLNTKTSKDTMLNLQLLAALSQSLGETFLTSGMWTLLYSSIDHGQAGNRFQHHCYLYKGPTFILMKDQEGNIYGVAVDEEWRERTASFGKGDCRLFRIMPSFCLVDSQCKVYDNLKTRSKTHGFGFGQQPEAPETATLWLNPTLDSGFSSCASGSPLAVPKPIKIWRVEVWGCGTAAALSRQETERLRERQAAEKKQMAHRPNAAEWHDSPDRLLLTMAGALKLDKLDEEARVSTRRTTEEEG